MPIYIIHGLYLAFCLYISNVAVNQPQFILLIFSKYFEEKILINLQLQHNCLKKKQPVVNIEEKTK